MAKKGCLARTAFISNRAMEFFTERELTTQIGYGKALWPLVLAKELIDNALDACESTNVCPEIVVTLAPDAFTVRDNGPGVKPEIIDHSLDYHVRISDKKYYVSPTRGQLGNALKCLWAAPFVADGERGLIEVTGYGWYHRIEVRLDRIAQVPNISHHKERLVRKGTCIKVYWTGIASLETQERNAEFYQAKNVAEALGNLVADFSALNPHAAFKLALPNRKVSTFPASDPRWRKWRTSQPTSAHWYTPADLQALIAAYIKLDKHTTLRDFIAEFDGLSGTKYRKGVLTEAGLSAAHLQDLVVDGDVGIAPVERLLIAMQHASRPVKPQRLGVIGKKHLRAALVALGADPEGFTYRKGADIGKDGLPFVVEVAFGVTTAGRERLIVGLNHSPVFKVPSGHLSDVLTDCHVQRHDPVALLIHQGCPRFMFTNRGKGAIA
jgi:DNA topoisomerase VI subunit B